MVQDWDDAFLHELTFLTALSCYYCGNNTRAEELYKYTFYSAHSIKSCYASICNNYAKNTFSFPVIENLPAIPLIKFPEKEVLSYDFQDGTFDSSLPEYKFGDLIRDLRMDQNVSQTTLCYGLCSKSKLSKIENNTLMPSGILASTLLQRLGISDSIFDFYSDIHESKLYELKKKIICTNLQHDTNYLVHLNLLQNLTTSKDILYKQFIYFEQAILIDNPADKIDKLYNSLFMSVPNFNWMDLNKYRLSWMELTLLNNICSTLAKTNESFKSIHYFYRLIDYIQNFPYDPLTKKATYTISINQLFRNLYANKSYTEMISQKYRLNSNLLQCNTAIIGVCYSYLCQSYGECNNYTNAQLFLDYAYSNHMLNESFINAELIATYMNDDFNISY